MKNFIAIVMLMSLALAGVVKAESFSQTVEYKGVTVNTNTYSHDNSYDDNRHAGAHADIHVSQNQPEGQFYIYDSSYLSFRESDYEPGMWNVNGYLRFLVVEENDFYPTEFYRHSNNHIVVNGVQINLGTNVSSGAGGKGMYEEGVDYPEFNGDIQASLSVSINSPSATIYSIRTEFMDYDFSKNYDEQYMKLDFYSYGHLPEPATMSLVGLSGLMMFRRRHKMGG